MAENLLWPKKLTEPPQLLVDVEALFKSGNLGASLVGFGSRVSPDRTTFCRFNSVGIDGPDTFRIGFVADVTKLTRGSWILMSIAVPFQRISTEIIKFNCHGWSAANAALGMTPDKTVEATSLINPPDISHYSIGLPGGSECLFKMESPEFESTDDENRFSSGSGVYINYDYENRKGDLSSESAFADMWNKYQTVAFETIVKVTVNRSYSLDNGFRLGVVEP